MIFIRQGPFVQIFESMEFATVDFHFSSSRCIRKGDFFCPKRPKPKDTWHQVCTYSYTKLSSNY